MPLLSGNTREKFGLQLSGTGTISWAISSTSQLDQRIENVSAQGVIYVAGISTLDTSVVPPEPHGASSRELQFFSCINQDVATITVTLGKVVRTSPDPNNPASAFFQFSPPTVLQAGQTFTYVKGAGFIVYDATGRPETSSSHS